jgi:hypothetical protein
LPFFGISTVGEEAGFSPEAENRIFALLPAVWTIRPAATPIVVPSESFRNSG